MGVADGVVVEAAGQPDARHGAREVVAQRLREPAEVGGEFPQFPAEQVLGHLAVAVDRRSRVGGERGQVAGPILPHDLRMLAGQLLGETGPPLQLAVQRHPGLLDPVLEPPQPRQGPGEPGQQDEDDPDRQQPPDLDRHGASG